MLAPAVFLDPQSDQADANREFILLVYILSSYIPITISSSFQEVRELYSLPSFHFLERTSTNYVWLPVHSYWWVYKHSELIHNSSLIFSLIPTTLLCTYAHILCSLNKLLRLFHIFHFTIVLTIAVDITTRILYSSQIRYPQSMNRARQIFRLAYTVG